jgi:hypothetical protein
MTTLNGMPMMLTVDDCNESFHLARETARNIMIEMSETHQVFIVRWSDTKHNGFSVLIRPKR